MKYTNESVSEVAKQYAMLRESLKELDDIRTEKGGAVLAFVFGHYQEGKKAVEFLKTIPVDLQKRLRIGELERQLGIFANTHITL